MHTLTRTKKEMLKIITRYSNYYLLTLATVLLSHSALLHWMSFMQFIKCLSSSGIESPVLLIKYLNPLIAHKVGSMNLLKSSPIYPYPKLGGIFCAGGHWSRSRTFSAAINLTHSESDSA